MTGEAFDVVELRARGWKLGDDPRSFASVSAVEPLPVPDAPKVRVRKFRSGVERRFAAELNSRGVRWWYEPFRLRLTEPYGEVRESEYLTDFVVLDDEWRMTLYDTKGEPKRDKERAMLKLKMAGELCRERGLGLQVVRWSKEGAGWVFAEYAPATASVDRDLIVELAFPSPSPLGLL